MEPVSLAIGVVALFSSCSSAFRLVRKGQSFGKDYKILETKFANQELRLRAWGRASGLLGDSDNVSRIDEDSELGRQVKATLECIDGLLSDGTELKSRYGLKPGGHGNPAVETPTNSTEDEAPADPNLGELSKSSSSKTWFLLRRPQPPQVETTKCVPVPLKYKGSWIIEDKEKFAELIGHLKDLVDDLESLTQYTDIPRRQRVFVDYEVESIYDIEALEDMEAARQDVGDIVSDAASSRLETLSRHRSSARSSLKPIRQTSSLRMETQISLRTASEQSISSIISFRDGRQRLRGLSIFHFGRKPPSETLLTAKNTTPDSLKNANVNQIPKCKFLFTYGMDMSPGNPLEKSKLGNFLSYNPSTFSQYSAVLQTPGVGGLKMVLRLSEHGDAEDKNGVPAVPIPRGPTARAVIIHFLITPGRQFEHVPATWVDEVRDRCGYFSYILVGIEPDGQHDRSEDEINQGELLAQRIGAAKYLQCNVDTEDGFHELVSWAWGALGEYRR